MKYFVFIIGLLILAGGGYWLYSQNTNQPVLGTAADVHLKKIASFGIKEVPAGNKYANIGIKGVTGDAYLTIDALNAHMLTSGTKRGWYSWQGNDVVWVPAWREEDPKIAFKIPDADIATFVMFEGPEEAVWAKDTKNAYFKYMRILQADPVTFEVVNEESEVYAHDAHFRYQENADGGYTATPYPQKATINNPLVLGVDSVLSGTVSSGVSSLCVFVGRGVVTPPEKGDGPNSMPNYDFGGCSAAGGVTLSSGKWTAWITAPSGQVMLSPGTYTVALYDDGGAQSTLLARAYLTVQNSK